MTSQLSLSKIVPRDYQDEAVSATALELSRVARTLIVAPTASGKSIMIAALVKRILNKNPDWRILVLCHQGHLLTQNEEKILDMVPDCDTGIYCAGVDSRKEYWSKVVLASRDSLGRKPDAAGMFNVVIIDEAHMVTTTAGEEKDDTYYSRIIKNQGLFESCLFIGLSGSPWRVGNGDIYGEDCFFESVAYDIKMKTLQERGYLCYPVFPKEQKKIIDADSLRVSSYGDFTERDLNEISPFFLTFR